MPNKQIDDLLKKVNHSLSHSFQWLLPLELTKDDLTEFKLVKGVAMSEGELKSGEVMTRDNVIAGAGAMRAAAIMGIAQLDIDHYEDELPKEYAEKYGAEINDPYPPGLIIDAQAVDNIVDGKKIAQVEYLAIIFNDLVYDLIKDHKIKGNSVVDYPRSLNCDKCETDKCTCEYSGSAYLYNTLILDEVPNSNSTWVDVVTESDLEQTIKNAKGKELKKLKHQFEKSPTKIQIKLNKVMNQASSKVEAADYENLHELEGDLDSYMTDGIWNDGKDSIIQYLIDEKEIDEDVAKEMAAFLIENTDILNQYQLRYLSTEDLTTWWNTFNYLNQQLKTVKRNIATLGWLEHNALPLKQLNKIKQDVQYGQGEVNYGQPGNPDAQCLNCRWFSPYDFDDPAGSGYCNIVTGDIQGTLGCDQFNANPVIAGAGETEAPPEGEEPVEEEPPEIENQEDEVEPDEDGECPDGYVLSEDGTKCVKTISEGEGETNVKDEQPAPVPESLKKLKHSAIVEKNPETVSKKQAADLDIKINELKTKQKRIQLELKRISPFDKRGKERSLEFKKLTKEINRLETLKKKY